MLIGLNQGLWYGIFRGVMKSSIAIKHTLSRRMMTSRGLFASLEDTSRR